MKKFMPFTIIYLLILCAELVVIFYDLQQLRYLTKPALVISLLIYYLSEKSNNVKPGSLITLALLFSLVGDVFLMFADDGQLYFIAGLLGFLLAHICYIGGFFNTKYVQFRSFLTISILLLSYAFAILYFIYNRLNELLPYVICYMIVLLLMVKTMYLRKGFVNRGSFILAFSGAMLFMVSDSILAWNKFYAVTVYADELIMLTYGLAQLFIVSAALIQVPNEKKIREFHG